MERNPWVRLGTPVSDNNPQGAPHSKQRIFLYLGDVKEVMYGGAAGGGKSSALLLAAAQYVDVPGYAALLLRSSFPDLMQPDALIPRSKDWWLGKGPKWNPTEKRWTFPSGATITFGYLERDDHVYQYQGAAYQFIGIDELTQHTEFRYRYLFSRLRKPGDGPLAEVPLRMRSASNPGGRGHEWVKNRFIDPRTREKGAVFVPASLKDNPSLNAVEYIKSLSLLDPITRAQLLQGDWNAFEGGRFKKEWFYGKDGNRGWWLEVRRGNPYYCWTGGPRDGVPVGLCWTFVICDPAARAEEFNDNTAIGAFAVTPGGEVLVLEVVREHLDIEAIVPRIADLCRTHKPLWVGIESTAFQIAIVRAAQKDPRIPAVKPLEPEGKSKLVRATPAIIMASTGQILVPKRGPLHPWVEDYVGELTAFTGLEDEDGLVDAVDMTAYGIQSLVRGGLAMPTLITPEEAHQQLDQIGGGGIFMA